MRRTLLIFVAVAALAIVVVATAPASLAGVAVDARARDDVLTLADAEGTLWHGRGTLAAPRSLPPPARVVDRRVAARCAANGASTCCRRPRRRNATRRRSSRAATQVALRDVDVTLPADVVEGAGAAVGRSASTATLHLTTPSLDWTPVAFGGGARLDWQDAQLALAGRSRHPARHRQRGARCGDGDRLTGPVTNDGGAFEVRGTVSLAATGAPGIAVTMTPRDGDAGAGAHAQRRRGRHRATGPSNFGVGPP